MAGCLVLCLAVLCSHLFGLPTPAIAVSEVKIAIVVPLSGRWARQGALYKAGSDIAIDEINAQGGIKALGGPKSYWYLPTQEIRCSKPPVRPSAC
jgi:branched-chain amino acid transport system substrate-binding protein